MRNVLAHCGIRDAIDVGCNGGWFVMRIAEMGVPVLGVDGDSRFSRILLFEASRRKLDVGVLTMRVDLRTVSLIPSADCLVFLSVWHHTVKEMGLEEATTLLRELWLRARRVLFFDTGENEIPQSFGLPEMIPNSQHWLADYLATVCVDGVVQHLGHHAAFAPDGTPASRNLFAVVRRARDDDGAGLV
jgi:hypothetical protein